MPSKDKQNCHTNQLFYSLICLVALIEGLLNLTSKSDKHVLAEMIQFLKITCSIKKKDCIAAASKANAMRLIELQ